MFISEEGQRWLDQELAARKRQYLRFLQSPEWRAACRRVHERFNYLCVVCRGSEGLEVHHSCYDYPNRPEAQGKWPSGWLPVSDAGLVLMCDQCHHALHRFWRT